MVRLVTEIMWEGGGGGQPSFTICTEIDYTVKPVLSGHSKIDKTKILMTNGSLMKVKVLQNAPIGAFCITFDLH